MKKLVSFVLAVLLSFSLSSPAWAELYNVDTPEQMTPSWDSANSNADETNYFIIRTDVDMGARQTENNKTYLIGVDDGHALSNASFSGGGTVEIVVGTLEGGLAAVQDCTVTVGEDCDVDLTNVSADNDGVLSFEGDLNAQSVMITNGGTVTVEGDLTTDGNGHENMEAIRGVRADTVRLLDDASLTVEGDADIGSIIVADSSEAEIGGDLNTDIASSLKNGSGGTHHPSAAVHNESTLTVGGNVYGTVSAAHDSTIDVAGDIRGDYGDYAAIVGKNIPLDAGMDGGTRQDPNDESKLYAQNVTSISGTAVVAEGKTVTSIRGANGTPVDIDASDHATVTIYKGKPDNIVCRDFATVTVYNSASNPQGFTVTTYHKKASGTLDDKLVNMCMEYAINSKLNQQYDDMWQASRNLGIAFDKKISSSLERHIEAILIASTQKTDVFASWIVQGADSVRAALKADPFLQQCNEDSVKSLINAKSLNPYATSVYRDTLASLLDKAEDDPDLQDVIQAGLKADKKALSVINKGIKVWEGTGKLLTDGNDSNAEQISLEGLLEYLDDVFASDGQYTELAEKYAGFKGFLKSFSNAASVSGKVVKWGSVAVDLANYWFEDCTTELATLDALLVNQHLSPEAFVAALSIRKSYIDKVYGTSYKALEVAADEVVDFAVNAVETDLGILIDTTYQLASSVTGETDVDEAKMTAAIMTEICPDAINSYEQAILKVKSGDHSDEAVMDVELSYAFAKACLEEYYNSMITMANKSDAKKYGKMLTQLETMKLGKPNDKIH